jgi:uncharacterized protein with FMN-binding domain
MTPARPHKPTTAHTNQRSRPSLARRALPAIALTSASGFLLSVLDRPSTVVDAGSDASSTVGTVGTVGTIAIAPTAIGAAANTPAATAPAPPTPTEATASTQPTATDPAAQPDTTVAETTPATVATTVAPAPTCAVYNGPTVDTRWGPVQVQASVASDGTICWADAIVTPNSRSKSVQINNRAVPTLDSRAVAAQGTNFDGVSGATITTNGYQQSLQAILDAVTSGQVG